MLVVVSFMPLPRNMDMLLLLKNQDKLFPKSMHRHIYKPNDSTRDENTD